MVHSLFSFIQTLCLLPYGPSRTFVCDLPTWGRPWRRRMVLSESKHDQSRAFLGRRESACPKQRLLSFLCKAAAIDPPNLQGENGNWRVSANEIRQSTHTLTQGIYYDYHQYARCDQINNIETHHRRWRESRRFWEQFSRAVYFSPREWRFLEEGGHQY